MGKTIKCTKCKKEVPFDYRPTDNRRLDGYSGNCKDCIAEYSRTYYFKNHEKAKLRNREYYRDNREKFDKKADRYPEKMKARLLLRNAVKSGKVEKLPCEVCGEPEKRKVHGHHDDYTKSLEVRWLCTKHHGEMHRRLEPIKSL